MIVADGHRVSLRGLVEKARVSFKRAAIPEADLDARVLACAAAGAGHVDLIANGDAPVGEEVVAVLDTFIERRLAREPVSRIIGQREFWSLTFDLGRETLDPRADSETLIEAVVELSAVAGQSAPFERICDLGTGSGCLLVSLLCQFQTAIGVGVDICAGALRVARRNAMAHRADRRALFVCADWTAPLSGPFDLVISNPPYIRSADIATLEPEVRCHDPHRALDGGTDGLDAYRQISSRAAAILRPDGWFVVEVGAGQAGDVKQIMKAAGMRLDDGIASGVRDGAGVERCVRAQV